jgi:hypothetical protein
MPHGEIVGCSNITSAKPGIWLVSQSLQIFFEFLDIAAATFAFNNFQQLWSLVIVHWEHFRLL